jgi:hypothetical protein
VINETAIQAANFVWSIYLLIMLDTFSTLHYVSHNYISFHFTTLVDTSSHLNFTQLHFTTLSFGLTTFKFPTAPFHFTSLHFTSLHFTALLDDFRHTSIPVISPVYNWFHNSLKILGLKGKVPNGSAGSWFQFLMVLFAKEYFPISVLYFLP